MERFCKARLIPILDNHLRRPTLPYHRLLTQTLLEAHLGGIRTRLDLQVEDCMGVVHLLDLEFTLHQCTRHIWDQETQARLEQGAGNQEIEFCRKDYGRELIQHP